METDMTDKVKENILKNKVLQFNLTNWFERDRENKVISRTKKYDEWLHEKIAHVAAMIRYNITPDRLVEGMWIQAVGDRRLYELSRIVLFKSGVHQTDINCYVEDRFVYSSLWMNCSNIEVAEKWAYFARGFLMAIGYHADVDFDKEHPSDVTVSGYIHFEDYCRREGK